MINQFKIAITPSVPAVIDLREAAARILLKNKPGNRVNVNICPTPVLIIHSRFACSSLTAGVVFLLSDIDAHCLSANIEKSAIARRLVHHSRGTIRDVSSRFVTFWKILPALSDTRLASRNHLHRLARCLSSGNFYGAFSPRPYASRSRFFPSGSARVQQQASLSSSPLSAKSLTDLSRGVFGQFGKHLLALALHDFHRGSRYTPV